jgi:hypothetical protein
MEKGGGRVIIVQETCTHICKCKIWYLSKLLQELGDRRIKRTIEGMNSCMTYLIYWKNLCKWNNVSPPSKTIKEKNFLKN